MMIDPKRLESGLKNCGFELFEFCKETRGLSFVRRHSAELFTGIAIGQGRTRGEPWGKIVHAGVSCTVTPTRLGEGTCLVELADENLGGWKRLNSSEDARRWEDAVIDVAPRRAREFAEEVGPLVLKNTKEERDAAKRYGELTGFNHDPQKLLQELRGRASDDQRSEVDRIMKSPIIMIPDGRIYYELAALTIALCAGEVDGDPEWIFGIDPDVSHDRRLMNQLQILASRFAHEPGWELPVWCSTSNE